MAENLVTYCVVHQPRRIKLPAQVIPRGTTPADMAGYLLDDVMNKRYFDKVAKWCYYPASQMFLDMLDQGYKLGIGFSVSFLWQLERWDKVLTESFRKLVSHPNCELIGVDPYHSFAFALDIGLFQEEMRRGKEYAENFFGKEIRVNGTGYLNAPVEQTVNHWLSPKELCFRRSSTGQARLKHATTRPPAPGA